ncbi:MAG: hypothetical protein QOD73_1444 [Solirubrobacteraceae bacterium]|nr:hypothetical protein [Solirubrobacteraceae bacterium]
MAARVRDVTDAIQGLIHARMAVNDRCLAGPAVAPQEVAQG